MARRKSPESEAVAFFETAPIDVAQAVLNIAKGIVQRRQGGPKPRRVRPVNSTETRAKLPLGESVERAS